MSSKYMFQAKNIYTQTTTNYTIYSVKSINLHKRKTFKLSEKALNMRLGANSTRINTYNVRWYQLLRVNWVFLSYFYLDGNTYVQGIGLNETRHCATEIHWKRIDKKLK